MDPCQSASVNKEVSSSPCRDPKSEAEKLLSPNGLPYSLAVRAAFGGPRPEYVDSWL